MERAARRRDNQIALMRSWDQPAIENLFKEVCHHEDAFLRIMNYMTPSPNYPLSLVRDVSEKGNGAHHDAKIFYTSPDRTEQIDLGNVEFECGTTQEDWSDEIPSKRRWPHGLRLVSRKTYTGKNLFFIKYSKTYESAFFVDCLWFRGEVEKERIVPKRGRHSLNMKTCDEFYCLGWDILERECAGTKNRQGHVFWVERSEYPRSWRFIQDRLGLLGSRGEFLHPVNKSAIQSWDGNLLV